MTTEILTFVETVNVTARLNKLNADGKSQLYTRILKLLKHNYRKEAKDFEQHPSEDHIMIDISRIRSEMFPNQEI